MLNLGDRITIDPNMLGGKPTIRGMEISPQTILGHLAVGNSKEKILEIYPFLEPEDIDAAVEFMGKVVRGDINVNIWGEDTVQEPDPVYRKILRIWKHIEITESWKNCDTSILDDISDSWSDRRKNLIENSQEYNEFLGQLKRRHAIETGIVERMYDLSRNITETLVKEGFDAAFLSHDDSDIPTPVLMKHLNDHLEAVDFVFDVVKKSRPLSVSFIKQLHQLVTRHQYFAEGRDQFGNQLKIPLLRGDYKIRENNPSREDGTVIMYCPPEHVASEMDNLISIFQQLVEDKTHPLVIAAWFHHAFTTIHPFQDGNGRVARLLASLIFIKFGFFPFTVLREEAKSEYIKGLEAADKGEPQAIVNYFADVQKRSIKDAMNIGGVDSVSLTEVQNVLLTKLKESSEKAKTEHQNKLAESRKLVFDYCEKTLHILANGLEKKMGKWAEVNIFSFSFDDPRVNEKGLKFTDYYFRQVVSYAKLNNYFFNRTLPKAWIAFNIQASAEKKYRLVVTLHHYGYDDATLAIGSFLELKNLGDNEALDSTLPLPIPPHVISINGGVSAKEKNIKQYLENALTLSLAQIASEI